MLAFLFVLYKLHFRIGCSLVTNVRVFFWFFCFTTVSTKPRGRHGHRWPFGGWEVTECNLSMSKARTQLPGEYVHTQRSARHHSAAEMRHEQISHQPPHNLHTWGIFRHVRKKTCLRLELFKFVLLELNSVFFAALSYMKEAVTQRIFHTNLQF